MGQTSNLHINKKKIADEIFCMADYIQLFAFFLLDVGRSYSRQIGNYLGCLEVSHSLGGMTRILSCLFYCNINLQLL